jgi:uncharacterized protein HemX
VSTIILQLQPSEPNLWQSQLAQASPAKPTARTDSHQNNGAVESGISFAKDVLFSPGASWMVSFLCLSFGIGYVVYAIGRFANQIGKQIDVAKITSSVVQNATKSQEIIKEIGDGNVRTERKIDAIVNAIEVINRDIRELYSKVNEVRSISKDTGDELSGQLHTIERDLQTAKQEILKK